MGVYCVGSIVVVSKHVGHIQGVYTGKPMSIEYIITSLILIIAL